MLKHKKNERICRGKASFLDKRALKLFLAYGGPSFGSSYGQFGGGGPSRQNKGMNRSNPY